MSAKKRSPPEVENGVEDIAVIVGAAYFNVVEVKVLDCEATVTMNFKSLPYPATVLH